MSRAAILQLTCFLLVWAAPGAQAPAQDAPDPGEARPVPAAPTNISPASGIDEGEPGIVEFVRRFSGHEPIYFVAGPKDPNIKFQFSFKYAILDPKGSIVRRVPALAGVNVAYTQTSLWDVGSPSSPFFDSSYKPEALWSDEYIRPLSVPGRFRLGLQAGVQHESNGKAGEESRSLNIAYVRPIITFGDLQAFHVTVAPRIFGYLGGLGDNPDIGDYRGYCDLRVTAGWDRRTPTLGARPGGQ